MNFEIVILAKSIKHSNYCVAGKRLDNREWIRPVADAEGSELNGNQIRVSNCYGVYQAKVLQKVLMSFSEHAPLPQQPENYVISDKGWRQNYKIAKNEVVSFLDYPESLWGEGPKVYYRDIVDGTISIDQSLYLVAVEEFSLYKNQYGKRRAMFVYNNLRYDLPVTDPEFDNLCCAGEATPMYLCLSLGERYADGCCYKLVATIF